MKNGEILTPNTLFRAERHGLSHMKINKKNVLTTSLAATLAAAMIIGGGTIAYLQDDTEKVVNEFDTNKVLVKLSETGTNDNGINDSYEIIPGTSAAKDPKVTVDNTLDSYVYVRVTDTTENLVIPNRRWLDAS